MEVEGDFALFASPDSGSESCSYPAPPYSAVKGMFESVLFLRHAEVVPTKLHICRPVCYCDGGINYTSGPLRKHSQIVEKQALQRRRQLLCNICYQLFADIRNLPVDADTVSESSKAWLHVNHAHSYMDQFNRRLKSGKYWNNVHLGHTEFMVKHVGPLRPTTQPCKDVNLTIHGMLHHPFSANQFGDVAPRFTKQATIKSGVLTYAA